MRILRKILGWAMLISPFVATYVVAAIWAPKSLEVILFMAKWFGIAAACMIGMAAWTLIAMVLLGGKR